MATNQFNLPDAVLQRVRTKMDQMRLSGKTVTPAEVREMYRAAWDSVSAQMMNERKLAEEKRQYNTTLATNIDFKNQELDLQKDKMKAGNTAGYVQAGTGLGLGVLSTKMKTGKWPWQRLWGSDESSAAAPDYYGAGSATPMTSTWAGYEEPPTPFYNPSTSPVGPNFDSVSLMAGNNAGESPQPMPGAPGPAPNVESTFGATTGPMSPADFALTSEAQKNPGLYGQETGPNTPDPGTPVANAANSGAGTTPASGPTPGLGVNPDPSQQDATLATFGLGESPTSSTASLVTQNPADLALAAEDVMPSVVPELASKFDEAANGVGYAADSASSAVPMIGTALKAGKSIYTGIETGDWKQAGRDFIGDSMGRAVAGEDNDVAGAAGATASMAATGASIGSIIPGVGTVIGGVVGGVIGLASSIVSDCLVFHYFYGPHSKELRYARVFCFRHMTESELLGYYTTALYALRFVDRWGGKKVLKMIVAAFYRYIHMRLDKSSKVPKRYEYLGRGLMALFRVVKWTGDALGRKQFLPVRTCLPLIRERDREVTNHG